MNFCIILFVFWSLISAVDPPKWMIEEGRLKYREHEECMRARAENFQQFQYSQHFHGVFSMQGSIIKLKCFECLDPADAAAIEDVWKPNESLISRKIQKAFDKVKEAVKRFKPQNGSKGKFSKFRPFYYWEYLSPNDGKAWMPVMDMYEPVQASAKVAKMMRSFLKREKQRFTVGNHFELEILRSNVTDTGWYRCVQREKLKKNAVVRGYFVDVVPNFGVKMMKYDSETITTFLEPKPVLGFSDIEMIYRGTPWTACNKCGHNREGESRRQLSCYIRSKSDRQRFASSSNFSSLQLLAEIPCVSALVPESVRNELSKRHAVIELYQTCQSPCPPSHNETRIVEGFDEDGTPLVVDKLMPGEFAIDERLPPLKESVRRKVIRRKAGEPIVLDCGTSTAGEGIIWRKDYKEINSSSLLGDDDRKLISAKSRLIIRKLEAEDSGIYSCSTLSSGTTAVFFLHVATISGEAAEYVSAFQLILRFVAVVLLVYLFVSMMMSAKSSLSSTAAPADIAATGTTETKSKQTHT